MKGKTIVITGASSGIGEALAVLVGRKGARVVLAARRRERLEKIALRIRNAGGSATAVACDVTLPAQAESLIGDAIRIYGSLDVLVNNAGRGHFARVEETTDDIIRHMFEVNVYALWYTSRPALRVMRKQGSGHIINIASMAGKIGFPFNSAYVAAKHACVGFTHALRAELVETGITASVVCPGGVDTRWSQMTEGGPLSSLFSAAGPAMKRIAEERGLPLTPVEGVVPPEAVAEAILECICHPVPEVYTHQGAREFAILAAIDRAEAERHQLAAFLGEREAYQAPT